MLKQTTVPPQKTTATSAATQTLVRQTAISMSESDAPPPTTDTTALFREVTQTFSNIMEEKLSFLTLWKKISAALESQSSRITDAEQSVSDVEDIVTGLEKRLAEAE